MAKRKITKNVASRKKGKAPKAPKKPKKDRKVTRQTALPGMGQVRNTKLDKLCENIGEARERKNEAITDEEGDSQAALGIMQTGNVTHYTHAGVELILRRGADKLSIKLLKDKTAEGAPPAKPEADLAGDKAGDEGGDDANGDDDADVDEELSF